VAQDDLAQHQTDQNHPLDPGTRVSRLPGHRDGDACATTPGVVPCDVCGAVLDDAMAHLTWHLRIEHDLEDARASSV
jgi:hypothetical protein